MEHLEFHITNDQSRVKYTVCSFFCGLVYFSFVSFNYILDVQAIFVSADVIVSLPAKKISVARPVKHPMMV